MKAGKKTLKEGFYTCTHPNGLEGNYLYLYGTLYICSNQVAVLYGERKEDATSAILDNGKFLGNEELRVYTRFKNLETKKSGVVEVRFTYEVEKGRVFITKEVLYAPDIEGVVFHKVQRIGFKIVKVNNEKDICERGVLGSERH